MTLRSRVRLFGVRPSLQSHFARLARSRAYQSAARFQQTPDLVFRKFGVVLFGGVASKIMSMVDPVTRP
jgi:hypothetical protein